MQEKILEYEPYVQGGRRRELMRKKQLERKKRRRRIVCRLFVLFFITIMVLAGVIGMTQYIWTMPSRTVDFSFSPSQNGWTQSAVLSVVKRTHAVGVQYPVAVKNTDTNRAIERDARQVFEKNINELADFKPKKRQNRPVYTTSFQMIDSSDTYKSIVYATHRYNLEAGIDDVVYDTYIYDTQQGKSLTSTDIFKDGYAETISRLVINTLKQDANYANYTDTDMFRENTAADAARYTKVSFQDKTMTVYFNGGEIFPAEVGSVVVPVPIDRIYRFMNMQMTEYVPSNIDPDRPMIALTFDDGPHEPVTARILNVLEQNGGKATFFVVGERISYSEEVIKRGASLGCEYASHSYTHPDFTRISGNEIDSQLQRTADALKAITGKPVNLLRLPGANVNDSVKAHINTPIINWNIDTLDWKSRNADSVASILSNVSDGDIILMHDLYPSTADAVERIIPQLVDKGFQLVTVSEMFDAREMPLEAGKTYNSCKKQD